MEEKKNGEKESRGRPRLLTPELFAKAEGFLDFMETQKMNRVVFTKQGREEIEMPEPPTITRLAIYLDVNRDSLYQWASEDKLFSDILTRVKAKYEQVLVKYGLTDQYNANLAKFLLSADHDKREKSDLTSADKQLETPVLINSPEITAKIKALDEALKEELEKTL
jgi:hypothetical protein